MRSLLAGALAIDRLVAQREIARLEREIGRSKQNQNFYQRIGRLEKRLKVSIQKRNHRRENVPDIRYSDDLPIIAKKDEIIAAISKHPVVIIAGETGSGKTTQIPKFCLAAGRGIDGLIGCTQPRRIAAITVCQRIAEELGQKQGNAVGYKIRFRDRTPKEAYIKIMTDGILLAETQGDRYLNAYDTIIVDEAHERSLNIDFTLGILQTLLKKRNDLKLIITSATIDTQKFSKAFNQAPIIEVSGRMYPVEVRYFPTDSPAENHEEATHVELAVQAVNQVQRRSPWGDILVFMPTEQDIRETCELIATGNPSGATVMPLYARLAAAEQTRIFKRTAARKIIVATNVAETSITIPGIKYVIDSGLARISRYSPRSRTTSLPVVPVSKSSADQRKGRCGRVEDGVCIRLYSEENYLTRPQYTPPEIIRANLAEVILRMIALKLGDISVFPFIDRPDIKSIRDGFDFLVELGAIQRRNISKGQRQEHSDTQQSAKQLTLTDHGRLMAKIPLDPRLSRMMIEAGQERCLPEITVVAAALSIPDPRERPVEKKQEADSKHSLFDDPNSDYITLLNIWNRYHFHLKQVKSTNQMKHYCRRHFLSFMRMREWRDIQSQIIAILREHEFTDGKTKMAIKDGNLALEPGNSHYASIHKSILSGFLSNIAVKKEQNFFRAAKSRDVMIFPGSGLFNKAGSWIVAAEVVETSRVFARTVANIDSSWLEQLGGDLCRRTYIEPHWEKNRGQVVATEQVSLFGLIIVPERKVSYGRIHPDEAAEIFIQNALVEGEVKEPFAFLKHNQQVIAEITDVEDRLRRRDLLVDEMMIFEFYRDKLYGICDTRTLAAFLKKKGSDQFLRLEKEALLAYNPDNAELALYPDRLALGNHVFDCSYCFDPGNDPDGVTIKVPSGIAPLVPADALDWMVPGLYSEKIAALVRGLPKKFRRKLVPVKDTVEIIVREMPQKQNALVSVLGEFIFKRFGIDIPASAWTDDILPDHLKMRVAITGPDGRELKSGRSRDILQQKKNKESTAGKFKAIRKKWEKTGVTRWDFGDLPDFISNTGTEDANWVAYPGLDNSGADIKQVALRLFQQRDEALRNHKLGVAALFGVHFVKDLKFLKKQLVLPNRVAPAMNQLGGVKRFEKRMFNHIVHFLFAKNIRNKADFEAHARATAPQILSKGRKLVEAILPVLTAFQNTQGAILQLQATYRANPILAKFLQSLSAEVTRLLPESFFDLYDLNRLAHVERYLKAIALRAQRALVDFEKDQTKSKEVIKFRERLDALLKGLSPSASEEKRKAIEDFFWLIEEYKVSVYAQELKTALPVSTKRLLDKLKEIERMR